MNSSQNTTECSTLVHHLTITEHANALIPMAVVTSVVAAYVVSANVTIITAITRYGTERYNTVLHTSHSSRSMTQLLMASMAVTDTVIGLVSMPLGIYVIATNGKWGLGDNLCQAWIYLDKILCTVSIYHVVCLSGDRYTAVCHPLKYRFMAKRTVYCLIAVCWTVPAMVSVLMVVSGWHHSGVEVLVECVRQSESCQAVYNTPFILISSTTDFYIPFAVIFVVYFLVLRKIQVLSETSVTKNIRRRFSSLGPVVTFRSLNCFNRPRSIHRETDSCRQRSEETSNHNTAGPNSINTESLVSKTSSPMPSSRLPMTDSFSTIIKTDSSTAADERTFSLALEPTEVISVVDISRGKPGPEDANALYIHDVVTQMHTHMDTSSDGNARPHRSSTKAYKTIGCIVLGFTVCWLPFGIFNVMSIYNGYSLPLWIILLFTWMGYVNSALNPILFCFNKSVRQAVITLLFPVHKVSSAV